MTNLTATRKNIHLIKDNQLIDENPPSDNVISGDELPEKSFVLSIWKHPWLMHYHMLFLLAVAINISVFIIGLNNDILVLSNPILSHALSYYVIVNMFLAIIIRQQYVINGLFGLATRVPKYWPLSVRALLAKVYHFGGIHSGCAVSAVFWFAFFALLYLC